VAEFKKFTFDRESLFAVRHFMAMAERALHNTSSPLYELKPKPNHKWGNFGEGWAGHWFEMKSTDSKNVLILFFGIVFNEEYKLLTIEVAVHDGENPGYFKVIEQARMESPSFRKVIRKEDGIIELRMRAEKFDSLNADSSKENQLSTLSSFLAACCDALLKRIRLEG
jgi:hypothetical protein